MFRRQLIIIMLILSLLPIAASAEPEEPHKLWELPYGHNAAYIQALLEAQGIPCSYQYYPKSMLLSAYATVKSAPEADLSMYGHPYTLQYSDLNETYTLEFVRTGPAEEKIAMVADILNALIEKYGSPFAAAVEFYSHGIMGWYDDHVPNTNEIIRLDPAACVDFSPLPLLEEWPYTQPETEISLEAGIYNIKITASFYDVIDPDQKTILKVQFFPHKTQIPKPKFEQTQGENPTPPPFSTDGF